jgi:hypothetical protein
MDAAGILRALGSPDDVCGRWRAAGLLRSDAIAQAASAPAVREQGYRDVMNPEASSATIRHGPTTVDRALLEHAMGGCASGGERLTGALLLSMLWGNDLDPGTGSTGGRLRTVWVTPGPPRGVDGVVRCCSTRLKEPRRRRGSSCPDSGRVQTRGVHPGDSESDRGPAAESQTT